MCVGVGVGEAGMHPAIEEDNSWHVQFLIPSGDCVSYHVGIQHIYSLVSKYFLHGAKINRASPLPISTEGLQRETDPCTNTEDAGPGTTVGGEAEHGEVSAFSADGQLAKTSPSMYGRKIGGSFFQSENGGKGASRQRHDHEPAPRT